MKISCVIVDDEKLARDLLKEYLEKFPDIEIKATCKNGLEAVQEINKINPDLVLLDVHMPGMNGLDVLDNIDHDPRVIFTTAYDQYAIKAFEKNAVDYLLKPIDEIRFREAIDRFAESGPGKSQDIQNLLSELSSKTSSYTPAIFVQKSEKYFKINIEDIMYVEASGDYTVISANNEQYVSSKGITRLEEKLDSNLFIRIHRSTIVNQEHLAQIEKHFNGGMIAKMKNGKTFPISRSYVKKIKERIL